MANKSGVVEQATYTLPIANIDSCWIEFQTKIKDISGCLIKYSYWKVIKNHMNVPNIASMTI